MDQAKVEARADLSGFALRCHGIVQQFEELFGDYPHDGNKIPHRKVRLHQWGGAPNEIRDGASNAPCEPYLSF